MILANQLVAERLVQCAGSKSILRKQDPYPPEALEDLRGYARCMDIPLDLTSSLTIQRSLELLQSKDFKTYQCVSRKLMSKLRAAAYCCVGDSPLEACAHFALGLKLYTHFTSPIRRYPDLVVHRQLQGILEHDTCLYDCSDFVGRISDCYSSGDSAGQAHERLFYAFLIRDKGMIELKAMVYDVGARRLGIYIPSVGLEKLITMGDQRSMGIKDAKFDDASRSLTLTFEEKKEEEKRPGRRAAVKYVAVKKAGAEKREEKPKEMVIRPLDEIYVGVYADPKPPLELLFKILRKA